LSGRFTVGAINALSPAGVLRIGDAAVFGVITSLRY
jgi:hypothetical protein